MSAMNTFEDELLSLIFENQSGPPNVGDATGLLGSSTAGSFYISLHTANPGSNEATGVQTTSEAAYTGYGNRVAVARSTAGWSVASGVADNDAAITFPASTSGPESETHFGVGSAVTGAGVLHLWGALTATLVVNNGITPSFAAGALDNTLD